MAKIQQVSDRITEQLIEDVERGRFSSCELLPPEVELAKLYQVSRNAVRESLTRMEREGWVTRKHGIGTIINRDIVNVPNRLDLNYELCRTIELYGKKPETDQVCSRVVPADEEIGGYLKVPAGTPLFRVSRRIRADGRPAVFCIDYFPQSFIVDRSYSERDLEEPIFYFLDRFCGGREVETNLSEVRALPATEEVSQALEVPRTCGLLFLSETGYDLWSKPILYSEEYFIDRVIQHTFVRKKI